MIIKTVNVMFAADNNYADQLLIAIKSILAHIPAETTVHFLILDNELTPQTKCLVRQITKQSHQVDFIKINQQLLKNCPESNHINKTAYYRILAPQILLRKGISRVLYLDVDILVQTDITPLYESHLGTNIVGAIIDPGQALALPRLGVSPEKSGNIYFNSGVMLIDTFRWEENQISELTLRFIN